MGIQITCDTCGREDQGATKISKKRTGTLKPKYLCKGCQNNFMKHCADFFKGDSLTERLHKFGDKIKKVARETSRYSIYN